MKSVIAFLLLLIALSTIQGCKKEINLKDRKLNAGEKNLLQKKDSGAVFVKTGGYSTFGTSTLYALNALTGAVKWEKTFTDYNYTPFEMPAVLDGIIYLITGKPGYIYAIETETGNIRWASKIYDNDVLDSRATAPCIANGLLYFCGNGSDHESTSVFAYDINTGNRVWEKIITVYDYDGTLKKTTANPTVANGFLYAFGQDDDAYIYALNALTGELKWKFRPLYSDYYHYSNPLSVNNMIYYNYGGFLYALNATSGVQVWRQASVQGSVAGGTVSPALYNNLVVVSGQFSVAAFDTATSVKQWTYSPASPYYYYPTDPFVSGNKIYQGYSNQLYALNANNGILKGSFAGITETNTKSPVITNGIVYQSAYNYINTTTYTGAVYAISQATGILLWKFSRDTRFGQVIATDCDGNTVYPSSSGMKQ